MFRDQRDVDRWNGLDPDTGNIPTVGDMMAKQHSKSYLEAYDEGQEAVRAKPFYAPQNPYDDKEETDKFEGWDDGAYSAGITEIYTNGVLNRSERR